MTSTDPGSSKPSPAHTPLFDFHVAAGGRMVDFVGWELPIQYEGVIAEHTWTRTEASLFDVSHMAIIDVWGDDPAADLERLTPTGVTTLAEGRQRYGLLTNDDGGVIDDFMVQNRGDHLTIVVNAARRDFDLAHLRESLPDCRIDERTDLALIALQGPHAAAVLAASTPELNDTVFLDVRPATIAGIDVVAARAGYTGEDGFELAVAADQAAQLADHLMTSEQVRPAGLGARDTLRLEAGMHLYGNDLDETISPIEAGLRWTIPKRRREAKDFPGAERIVHEFEHGARRIRVGLQPEGRRPVRDGTELRSVDGTSAGIVSSGGFGPSVDRPIALAYVSPDLADLGTTLIADVRGRDVACSVVELPFVPNRYVRG